MLAAQELRQITALLLFGRVQRDLIDAQIGVRAVAEADRGRGAGDLLHGDGVREVAQARPAVLRRHGHAEQAELAELAPQVARKHVAAVDLVGARREPLVGEAAHLIAHRVDDLAETEVELAVGGAGHIFSTPLSSDPKSLDNRIVRQFCAHAG